MGESNGCNESHEGHEEENSYESDESYESNGCYESNEGHEEEGSHESNESHESNGCHEGNEEMKIESFVEKGTQLLQEGQAALVSVHIEQEIRQRALASEVGICTSVRSGTFLSEIFTLGIQY